MLLIAGDPALLPLAARAAVGRCDVCSWKVSARWNECDGSLCCTSGDWNIAFKSFFCIVLFESILIVSYLVVKRCHSLFFASS